MQWRSINQDKVDNLWKEWCGKMEEEVLEKCQVEEAKKSVYKGQPRKLGDNLLTAQGMQLATKQNMQASKTEEEEMRHSSRG